MASNRESPTHLNSLTLPGVSGGDDRRDAGNKFDITAVKQTESCLHASQYANFEQVTGLAASSASDSPTATVCGLINL